MTTKKSKDSLEIIAERLREEGRNVKIRTFHVGPKELFDVRGLIEKTGFWPWQYELLAQEAPTHDNQAKGSLYVSRIDSGIRKAIASLKKELSYVDYIPAHPTRFNGLLWST
ncbi:hypothetical protein JXB27_04355 [Candidatus Woesearchaeota archaeon]|nr:hypothetical protein [Candidatus Woesearchaeota archaeon]